MAINSDFQKKVQAIIDDIDEDVLYYDKNEYWMIQSAYEYVEYYAMKHKLLNTSIALPLARGLHDGDHRKSVLIKGDISYRLPYVIHPLIVCKMLIDLRIPIPEKDLDILFAAALCHDMIEDIPFMDHGKELMIQYHLNRKVYEVVMAVSKKKSFTEDETRQHFDKIAENRLAILVKLSDRGNNVEDLYNMSARKVREYVNETETYILPLADYAKKHYPELTLAIKILEDKIHCLVDSASILVDRYEEREKLLEKRIEELRAENNKLRDYWRSLWKEEGGADHE